MNLIDFDSNRVATLAGSVIWADIPTFQCRTMIGAGINTNFDQRFTFNQVHNQFSNSQIAGAFMVDEFLTTTGINSIFDEMSNGVDFTDTTCPSGNPCTQCAAGKYKTVTGAAACTTCPAGLTSPIASTSSAACVVADVSGCNAGYTGPSGGPCIACVTGTYKTTAGTATCMTCPGNFNSPLGSSTLTDCTCDVGFTGPNGGTNKRWIHIHGAGEIHWSGSKL